MSETLAVGNWFVGANGNLFADMSGCRYCVSLIDGRNNASGYMVMRNGTEITGPRVLGAPAGHKTAEAAKRYAEWFADANDGAHVAA